jgi:hypothetical protein
LQIERNQLANRIEGDLVLYMNRCNALSDLERDRAEGIQRPIDPYDDPLPSATDCAYLMRVATDSEWEGLATAKVCAPYKIPRTENTDYDTNLVQPNEILLATCAQIVGRNQRLTSLKWLDPFGSVWPVLLGFALGVRLTRVHEER